MLKILFLILVVLSSVTFGQTQKITKSYKFFEYGKISSKLLKEKIDAFCGEVDKASWIGWVINYSSTKGIISREKQIRDTKMCKQEFPEPRITFLRIEDVNKSKTEFWIVPPGEEPPITTK